MTDDDITKITKAARTLRAIPSEKRSEQSRINGSNSRGRPKMTTNITRRKLEAWCALHRPDLAVDEINGNKGFYRRDAGPAASFRTCGSTWRDVAAALGMIQVPDRD